MEMTAYTYEVTMREIERLLLFYPFLEKAAIGSSVMGKEIPVLKLGNGSREVCYSGAFHANEWITVPVLLQFVEAYAQAVAAGEELYGTDARSLYQQVTLYVIPVVNPDGVDLVTRALTEGEYYARARQIGALYPNIPFPQGWKANIDGIDLNLQFPAGWEQAKEIKYAQGYETPAPRDYVGEAPLSAPESRAVYEFTIAHDFSMILAYHTQGEVIYWKYKDLEPADSRRIAEHFSAVSGYAMEDTPYASGNAGYKDWFILQFDRPGYTIEAGYGENPLPIQQFPEIYAHNTGILTGGMTEILQNFGEMKE